MSNLANAIANVLALILTSLVGQLGRRGRKKRPSSVKSYTDDESREG